MHQAAKMKKPTLEDRRLISQYFFDSDEPRNEFEKVVLNLYMDQLFLPSGMLEIKHFDMFQTMMYYVQDLILMLTDVDARVKPRIMEMIHHVLADAKGFLYGLSKEDRKRLNGVKVFEPADMGKRNPRVTFVYLLSHVWRFS